MIESKQDLDYRIGISMINFERHRQITKEGYSPEDDDKYTNNELDYARLAYAATAGEMVKEGVEFADAVQRGLGYWRWNKSTFKPSTRVNRNWVKAGALALAQLQHQERAGAPADVLNRCRKRIDFCASKITNPSTQIAELIVGAMMDAGTDRDTAEVNAVYAVDALFDTEVPDWQRAVEDAAQKAVQNN